MSEMLRLSLCLMLGLGVPVSFAAPLETSVTTLNNPSLGFSISYPSDWKPTRLFSGEGSTKPIIDFDVSLQTPPRAPESWIGVWFNVPSSSSSLSLPSFSVTSQERPVYAFDEFVRELTTSVESFGMKVVAARKVRVGGKEGYEVVYSAGNDIWQRIITVHYGKRRLVIAQHRTPRALYEQFEPAIQKVLASVKFESAGR